MGKYEKIRNVGWYIFNIGWTIVYLIWRIFFTVPINEGIVSIIAGLSLLIVEIIGMMEALVHYFNMSHIENHEVPVVPLEKYSDIDVFIATYNEPKELLYKTVNGCVNMDYPDKNKVHIYICDDGHREEIKELAKEMGVGYIDREDHEGAKAGNLNHAMSVTTSPLIATFDADMIPKHDFLMVTAAYFIHQEMQNEGKEEKDRVKLGFVQSPQSFYNPDLFQYNLYSENRIPNEQDYFYKDIQISRNRTNSVIYGGSNTLISREALESVGGFYTKSITEDFATGILIQKQGYICYAINNVLASGLSPDSLKGLINQRIRWARGCINTGRKMHIITSRKLKLSQKVNYLASIWYWYAAIKRFIYIMSPILFAVFDCVVVKCSLAEVIVFWLPMYLSSNVCLKMMSRNIRTTKWTNVYETVMFPFMLVPVILESFGMSMKKFKVTKKDRCEEKLHWGYILPHGILVVLSIIGIVKSIIWTFDTGRMDYMVILFWLILNLYNLIMSLYIIMGRQVLRKTERVFARVDLVIKDKCQTIKCVTKDFSEGGFCTILDEVIDFDEDEEVEVTFSTLRYKAVLKAKIIFVQKVDTKWKYSFKIVSYEKDYDEYLQIIYDREPTLPTNLDASLSSFDDLKINIKQRMVKKYQENRHYARVKINERIAINKTSSVFVLDYNFKYVLIKHGNNVPHNLTLRVNEQLKIRCSLEKEVEGIGLLFKVDNYDELHNNERKREILRLWMNECSARTDGVKHKKKKTKLVSEDEFSELEYL